MASKTQPLYEQYRPQSYADIIGHDGEKKRLDVIRRRRGTLAGQAYWISGRSGTGKTTLARVIASEVADSHNILEIDAGELSVGALREMSDSMRLYAMGEKSGRAFIINEAHGLTKNTIRQLLTIIEGLPDTAIWIFTTTRDGQDSLFEDYADAGPFASRCVQLQLKFKGLAQLFAARALDIARAEGLDGQPLAKYQRLANDLKSNFRAILQAIESGEMIAD